MRWQISRNVEDAILAHARDAHPRECCGLLFGMETHISAHQHADNVHPEPGRHFEIDPQALIDAHRAMRLGGPKVVGYYHSHPVGRPEPSPTDRELAAADGMIWAIIAAGEIKLWRAGGDGFQPLPYRVTEG